VGKIKMKQRTDSHTTSRMAKEGQLSGWSFLLRSRAKSGFSGSLGPLEPVGYFFDCECDYFADSFYRLNFAVAISLQSKGKSSFWLQGIKNAMPRVPYALP
jgi:hypothetical protein